MILNRCNFFSKTLKNHVDVNVLLPSMADNDCLFYSLPQIYEKKAVKALYLLHGALDDCSAWLRNTCVERYAQEHRIAVVMPSGQNGFYSNALYGLDYFDFITEELPRLVEYAFPVSSRREDRYIAGASMGGFGAAKCALRRPDLYRACGVFSGALAPGELEPRMTAQGFDFFRYDLIFGGADKVKGSRDDLFLLAEERKGTAPLPEAFVACGEDDANNYDMSLRFCTQLAECGFKTQFMGGPGLHDWDYWERCVREFLAFIV